MSITESSYVLRFFLALWLGLKTAAANSGVNKLCLSLERGVRRLGSGSLLWNFVWREGVVSRSWTGSLSCRLFTAIVNIPCAIAKVIWKAGRPVWEASLFCRLLTALGGATFFFLGLFMAVMLMAPHSMWNNTYALMGAVALTALFIAGSASRRRLRLELDTLGPYMTIYMAFICLALLGSLSTRMSMRFFAFHVTSFLIVLVVVSSVRKYEQLQLMVSLAVLGLSVAALYGCYQGYIGVDVVPSQQDMVVNAGMPGRVYSFFDNPNNFAEQLEMLLPLDLALFLNCRWRGKVLSLLSLGLGVVAIGYTYGRASWVHGGDADGPPQHVEQYLRPDGGGGPDCAVHRGERLPAAPAAGAGHPGALYDHLHGLYLPGPAGLPVHPDVHALFRLPRHQLFDRAGGGELGAQV